MLSDRLAAALIISALVSGYWQPVMALSGGPVMPEYVQFEPPDATDLIDFKSGDFTYSLPLGNVPGPAGDFPLSMSYHAGIKPNQEATWVGLGWTLNPGAINRSVNGIPDDQYEGLVLSYDYLRAERVGYGVTIGAGYGPFGLNMSMDTDQGFGMSVDIGARVGPVRMGATVGSNGAEINLSAGGVSVSIGGSGVGVGISGSSTAWDAAGNSMNGGVMPGSVGISGSAGAHWNWDGDVSLHSGVGLSYASNSVGPLQLAGVSLGTSGSPVNVSIAGAGFSYGAVSSGSGAVDFDGNQGGFGLTIPLPGGAHVSGGYHWYRHKWKYNIANQDRITGYLFQGGPGIPDLTRNDGFSEEPLQPGGQGLPKLAAGDDGIVPYVKTLDNGRGIPWKIRKKGRSLENHDQGDDQPLYPSPDDYSVAAAGLSGSFRPIGATKLKLYQVLKKIETTDENPAKFNFLLNPSLTDEFTQETNNYAGGQSSLFPYGYCRDEFHASYPDPYDPALLENDCTIQHLAKGNFLNDGNRIIFNLDYDLEGLDVPEYPAESPTKRYTYPRGRTEGAANSRMFFSFLDEPGGYFESENEPSSSRVDPGTFNTPWMQMPDHKSRILGGKRIDPILEGNSPNGPLKGFKITDVDGTVYFFSQPVKSLVMANYSTNEGQGHPSVIFEVKNTPRGIIDVNHKDVAEAFASPVSLAELGARIWRDIFKETGGHSTRYQYSYQINMNPHATQWLLTEIRGPNFVNFEYFNKDWGEERYRDLEYNVKLKYTEPEWVAWRSPYVPPGINGNEVTNANLETVTGPHRDVFHASFGIKELTYLKSVETATHRADFVMNNPAIAGEERPDARGWDFDWVASQATGNRGMPVVIPGAAKLKVLDPGNYEPILMPLVPTSCATGQPQFIQRHVSNMTVQIKEIILDLPGMSDQQLTQMINRQVTIGTFQKPGFLETIPSNPEWQYTGKVLKTFDTESMYDLDGNWTQGEDLGCGANPGFPEAVPGIANASPKLTWAVTIRQKPYYQQENGSLKLHIPIRGPETGEEDGLIIGDAGQDLGTIHFIDKIEPYVPSSPNYDQLFISPPEYLVDCASPPQNPPVELGCFEHFDNIPAGEMLVQITDIFRPAVHEKNPHRYLKELVVKQKSPDGVHPEKSLRKFQFEYDWSLSPRTPNSFYTPTGSAYPANTNSLLGKLTLKKVREVGCDLSKTNCDMDGNYSRLPAWEFDYSMEAEKNPAFLPANIATKDGSGKYTSAFLTETINAQSRHDIWGMYCPSCKAHDHYPAYDPQLGVAWNLERITSPMGAYLDIGYERDSFKRRRLSDYRLPEWNNCRDRNISCDKAGGLHAQGLGDYLEFKRLRIDMIRDFYSLTLPNPRPENSWIDGSIFSDRATATFRRVAGANSHTFVRAKYGVMLDLLDTQQEVILVGLAHRFEPATKTLFFQNCPTVPQPCETADWAVVRPGDAVLVSNGTGRHEYWPMHNYEGYIENIEEITGGGRPEIRFTFKPINGITFPGGTTGMDLRKVSIFPGSGSDLPGDGIRVVSLKSAEPFANRPVETHYSYSKGQTLTPPGAYREEVTTDLAMAVWDPNDKLGPLHMDTSAFRVPQGASFVPDHALAFAPSPQVVYPRVEVTVANIPGKTVYEFIGPEDAFNGQPLLYWLPQENKVVDQTSLMGMMKRKLIYAGGDVLTRQTVFEYGTSVPSLDDRIQLTGNANSLELGRFVEKWQYTKKKKASDCSGNSCDGYVEAAGVELTYERKKAFLLRTMESNEKTGLRTASANAEFDPVTGKPMVTATYMGPGSWDTETIEASNVKRSTPAYYLSQSPAGTYDLNLYKYMARRNMLGQLVRTDEYVWKDYTTSDGTSTGDPVDFHAIASTPGNWYPTGSPLSIGEAGSRLVGSEINAWADITYSFGYRACTGCPLINSMVHPIYTSLSMKPLIDVRDPANQPKLADTRALVTQHPRQNGWGFDSRLTFHDFRGKPREHVNPDETPMVTEYTADFHHTKATFVNASMFNKSGPNGSLAAGPNFATFTANGLPFDTRAFRPADAEWEIVAGAPSFTGTDMSLSAPFELRHILLLEEGRQYVVEFQVQSMASADKPYYLDFYCPADDVNPVGGPTCGSTGEGDEVTVIVRPGLGTYKATLNATGTYAENPTYRQRNRIRLYQTILGVQEKLSVRYLRAYPADAMAQTYIYDSRGSMIQNVDVNNVSTHYKQDNFGNLAAIQEDGGRILGAQSRSYGKERTE